MIKFWFVEFYPMTASGKVQKFILRENAIRALRLEEVIRMRTAQVSYWFKREYEDDIDNALQLPKGIAKKDIYG